MKNKNYVLPFSCDRITMKRLAIGFTVAITFLCASLVFGQAPTIDIFKAQGLQRNASPQGRKANNAELKKARLQKKVKFRLAPGLEADMTESDIFTSDFYVYSNTGKLKAVKKGKHYFDDHKFGAVSITDDNQVSGTMNQMAISQDGFQIDTIIRQVFETGEAPILPANQTGPLLDVPSATPAPFVVSCKQVRFFLEVTYPYYLASGGTVQGVVDNVSGWFAQVASIYLREGIVIKIQSIKVNQVHDAYSKITSSSAMLLSFAETEGVKAEAKNYDLGALIDLNTPGRAFGGIAYVNGINYAPAKYSSMGVDVTYKPAASYSWTVGCAAHEFGHNLGSKHTQWCGWDLGGGVIGAIDGCAQSEKNNGIQCTNIPRACIVGTIMSYCHICWPGSIDLNLGFGPLPGAAIRAGLAASNVPCVGNPPSPCSLWTYSPWSTCTNGTQTRTATGTPTGCTGTAPLALTQSCSSPCSIIYSDFGPCQPNGTQIRTEVSRSPNGCTGTPLLSQSCIYTPPPVATLKMSVKGVPYNGFYLYDSVNVYDGNTSNRYLTKGECTVAFTYSAPVYKDALVIYSGYYVNNVWKDFNNKLTLTIDGVPFTIGAFKPESELKIPVKRTGRVFVIKTNGMLNGAQDKCSRLREIQLK